MTQNTKGIISCLLLTWTVTENAAAQWHFPKIEAYFKARMCIFIKFTSGSVCYVQKLHRNMKHTQTLINQYTLTNRMHSCSWAFCFRMCVRLCVLMIRFNSGWRGLCLCPFMSWFYRLKHLTIYHSHQERAAKDAPCMWLNITVWNL